MYFAIRDNLSALEISGSEAADFLNDLLTAQIANVEIGQAQAACLLSPQGRILYDMLVFRAEVDRFWLQMPSAEVADLRKRLVMYRLRRPIGIDICEAWKSAVLFDDTAQTALPEVGFVDPRDAALGRHIVGAADLPIPDKAEQVDEKRWQAHRIARNVPEGPIDLVRNRALILEAGLDSFNAVDFSKGCYVGQEVTARTKYRGLVKRRILCIRSTDSNLASGMDVLNGDVVIGQVLSCAHDGSSALATLRLDAVQAHMNEDTILRVGETQIALHYPAHLPEMQFPE